LFVFLSVFVFTGLSAFPAEAAMADLSGEQVLQRYFAAQQNVILRGISMESTFFAKVPKLSKDGMVVAHRVISPSGEIRYETVRTEGDKGIVKDVIARLMTTEMDTPPTSYTAVAVNRQNYKFKHKGTQDRDGRLVHVFEVSPRKKKAGLFKGEIWVDQETGLPIREAGKLVKSPSVFLKDVAFVREYEIKDEHPMPLRTVSVSETRFWGKAEISIEYSNWTWTEIRGQNTAPSPIPPGQP
jgi:negative regulator of sigma E activity